MEVKTSEIEKKEKNKYLCLCLEREDEHEDEDKGQDKSGDRDDENKIVDESLYVAEAEHEQDHEKPPSNSGSEFVPSTVAAESVIHLWAAYVYVHNT
jgi:hypothetical protein